MKHKNLLLSVTLICVFAAAGCKPIYREIDGSQGEQGEQGEQGTPGRDGSVISKITIGEDGYLYVNGENTGIRAKPDITIGDDGYWYIDGEETGIKAVLDDNNDLPEIYIGENGYWYIGNKNTGIKAIPDETEPDITIDEDGYVCINGNKTGVRAPKDDKELEITIDEDGHICINGEKTETTVPQDDTELIITINEEGYVCINGESTDIQTHVEITVGNDGNIYINGEDSGVNAAPPIPPSLKNAPRNLAKVVLGRDTENAADVTAVIDAIGRTIKMGYYNNLALGDYFALASINIQADSGGKGKFTQLRDPNTTQSEGSRDLDFVIVAINPYVGINGNVRTHVVVHSRRVLSAMTGLVAGGYQMNSSDTNYGGYMQSKLRTFVINQVKNALGESGIPVHDPNKIIPLNRRVVNHGGGSASGTVAITDNVFIPTGYELTAYIQTSTTGYTIEPASEQAHFRYYSDTGTYPINHSVSSPLKQSPLAQYYGTTTNYWTATPVYYRTVGNGSTTFHYVRPASGSDRGKYFDDNYMATSTLGIAPAFAIGGY